MLTLGGWTNCIVACILADLFFAVFPMIFVWQLNMKRREKITIAGSMSLGIM